MFYLIIALISDTAGRALMFYLTIRMGISGSSWECGYLVLKDAPSNKPELK